MIRNKYLGFIAIFAVTLASCAGLGRMSKKAHTIQYKVTPSPIAQKGEQVPVEIKGSFPAKFFDKKTSVEVVPFISYEGKEMAFEAMKFQGENAVGNEKVISYEKGGSFSFAGTVPFDQAMEVADLKVRITGTRGSKTKVFPAISIAKGVSTTQQMTANTEKMILGADKFERVTKHQQKAVINFLVNSSAVRGSELRDQDVKDLNTFAKEIKGNEDVEVRSVVIEAYASPEGEIRRNEKLAEQRAQAAGTRVVKKAFSAARVKIANDLYNFIPKGEDWLGFKEMMQASDLKDKELILRILGMYTDLEKREQEIRNLAATYTEVAEKILPQLRRAQVTVNYDITGKSDEEILNFAETNSVDLNVEELLYATTLTNDVEKKMEFLRKAEIQFVEDARPSNNMGVLLFGKGDVAGARAKFEKSISIAPNAEAYNNLAVIERQAGNTAKALELYKKATAAGSDVNFNMGIAQIQNGEYAKAVQNLSGSADLNEALAMLLNGSTNEAKQILSAPKFESNANALYLVAVCDARNNNAEAAVASLSKAIALDKSLAAKAKKDVEFHAIAYLPAFKAL